MKNSRFSVRRIEAEIENTFSEENLIDLTDIKDKSKSDKQNCFLSRGVAAYTLYSLADISAKDAAESIVDGDGDNGIDAIYFDENREFLWLVQSKWKQKGAGQPDTGDLRKFQAGILDIQNRKKDSFNTRIQKKWDQIEAAHSSSNLHIKIVLTYTGGSLSSHGRKVMDDILNELNYYDDLASIEIFNLEEINRAIVNNKKENKIDVDVQLLNWGRVNLPYTAYYGQIKAIEIASWWHQYRGKLFNRNIRSFIGNSNVNQEITKTLLEEPTLFWYFNNGITVLCREIKKDGIDRDTRIGKFSCKGISVINGAQTIGSIGEVFNDEENRYKLDEADVSIRFISLEDCPEDFWTRVTRATNTQNRIEDRDFVALDSEQTRLQIELQALGKEYIYKRSKEDRKSDENCCNLREATIALACSNSDVKLAVLSKKEISKLWTDTKKEPYKKIFNSNLLGLRLWRSVEVLRAVDRILQEKLDSNQQGTLEKEIIEYGDRFILHSIFQLVHRVKKDALYSESFDFSGLLAKKIPEFTELIIQEIKDVLEDDDNGLSAQLPRLFKTIKLCESLKKQLNTQI